MTSTELPPISVWHTDTGVMLAVTKPGASPDDTATCVHLPPEHAAALIDDIAVALCKLGDWQRRLNDALRDDD